MSTHSHTHNALTVERRANLAIDQTIKRYGDNTLAQLVVKWRLAVDRLRVCEHTLRVYPRIGD